MTLTYSVTSMVRKLYATNLNGIIYKKIDTCQNRGNYFNYRCRSGIISERKMSTKIIFPKLLRLIFQTKICQKKRPLKRGSIHYTYEIFYIYRIRKM
jgi:hypothetical protein